MTLISFSLLSERYVLSFVLLPTGRTIYLPRRPDNEFFPTALASFRSASDKLRVQIEVNRQYGSQQIVAHDPAERYELWAGVFVPIVQQQTVTANTVCAPLFYKGIDPLGLLRRDPDYNFTHLKSAPAEFIGSAGFLLPGQFYPALRRHDLRPQFRFPICRD